MDYVGKTCPYCKTQLKETDDVVMCSSCEIPHHKDCWIENQGCTTFGCTGTIQGVGQQPASQTTQAVIYCSKCGRQCNAGENYCAACGNQLNVVNNSYSNNTSSGLYQNNQSNQNQWGHASVDDNEVASFIGNNAYYYIPKFNNMTNSGSTASWNWASFFLSTYWCFYRKMYGMGWILLGSNIVLMFLGGFGSVVSLAISITLGIKGNNMYMKYVYREISAAGYLNDYDKQKRLRSKGGTNAGVPIAIAVGIFIIEFIFAAARYL